MKKLFWPLFVGLIIIADRLTKIWALLKLQESPGVFVINNHYFDLKLFLSINKALAFSLPLNQIIIILLSFIIILLLLVYLIKFESTLVFSQNCFISLIIVGAISNLFDRIYYGGVIDFITFRLINFQYSIFNLADIFIITGGILFIIKEIKTKKI